MKTARTRAMRRAKRLPPGVPNPVDIHVGGKLRERRSLLGMSQEAVGDAVGLTFQQVQKYERGANRIGASRLFQFSRILDVPINYFFDDVPVTLRTPEQQVEIGRSINGRRPALDPLAKRETLELVRAYYGIADARARKGVFELAKALAKIDDGDNAPAS